MRGLTLPRSCGRSRNRIRGKSYTAGERRRRELGASSTPHRLYTQVVYLALKRFRSHDCMRSLDTILFLPMFK